MYYQNQKGILYSRIDQMIENYSYKAFLFNPKFTRYGLNEPETLCHIYNALYQALYLPEFAVSATAYLLFCLRTDSQKPLTSEVAFKVQIIVFTLQLCLI